MKRAWVIFSLTLILVLSATLNIYGNDFPEGYHSDELKKIKFIEGKSHDFHHPTLMIHFGKFLNFFFKFDFIQDILVLCRTMTAFFGVMIVLFAFLISRFTMSNKYSLLVAFALAVSPIHVVHSHYFKEDVIHLFFSILSLWILIRFIKDPNLLNLILLSISTGLTISSQYKGFLLFGIYLIIPAITTVKSKKKFYKQIWIVWASSILIFLKINNISENFQTLKNGIYTQFFHNLTGHFGVRIIPTDHFFLFHLKNSLIPGMTLIPLMFALTFVIYSFIFWKKTKFEDRLLLIYVISYYLLVEFSLSAPTPDYMRYVLNIVPILLYFSVKMFFLANQKIKTRWKSPFWVIFLMLLIANPLIQSIKLDYFMNRDTREIAYSYFMGKPFRPLFDMFSSKNNGKVLTYLQKSINEHKAEDSITHIIVSDFIYATYDSAINLKNQKNEVYLRYQSYEKLREYPCIEIKPRYKSFAFSNPTIRIYDVRSKLDRKKDECEGFIEN